ncbi:uncharacterized protein B0H64DRAFT_233849 [Chaetomium fimeti]|uniref:N-acetyltransferase domain-containing protein n=1 Tax=Chaetomium fimeti TaxID=1854472 RepID=A0AAE0H9W9_9PEZI|nr:hypothetical protein B0H64DRAFT_233849 [Chaetomium fimeti]
MSSPFPPRTWTREASGITYTISTDPSLIQLDAVNAAFATDMIYWAKPLPPDALQRCVEQSLCFGLYTPRDDNHPEMVGFARLITDHTTFGYLTDVYILPPHQGRGLGKWLLRCLDEVVRAWPDLRRCLLLTRDAAAVRMYREAFGARELRSRGEGVEGEGGGGGGGALFILERVGGGGVFTGEEGLVGKDGGAVVGSEE